MYIYVSVAYCLTDGQDIYRESSQKKNYTSNLNSSREKGFYIFLHFMPDQQTDGQMCTEKTRDWK